MINVGLVLEAHAADKDYEQKVLECIMLHPRLEPKVDDSSFSNGVTEPTKTKAEPIFAGQLMEFGVLGPDDDLSDSSEMKFATI